MLDTNHNQNRNYQATTWQQIWHNWGLASAILAPFGIQPSRQFSGYLAYPSTPWAPDDHRTRYVALNGQQPKYRWAATSKSSQTGDDRPIPAYYSLRPLDTLLARQPQLAVLNGEKAVWLAESIGITNTLSAFGEQSVNQLMDAILAVETPTTQHILVVADADRAGLKSAAKWHARRDDFTARGIELHLLNLAGYLAEHHPQLDTDKWDIRDVYLHLAQQDRTAFMAIMNILKDYTFDEKVLAPPQKRPPKRPPKINPPRQYGPDEHIDWLAEYERWRTDVHHMLDTKHPPSGSKEHRHCPNPSHSDKHPSFRISEKGVPQCTCGIQEERKPWELVAEWIGYESWEERKQSLLQCHKPSQKTSLQPVRHTQPEDDPQTTFNPPDAFLDAIEAALGVTAWQDNDSGFSTAVCCPFHEDTEGTAFWNRPKRMLYCHTCERSFKATEVGYRFGLQLAAYDPKPATKTTKRKLSYQERAEGYLLDILKADRIVNVPFITDLAMDTLPNTGMLLIKSPTGTGKTTFANQYIARLRDQLGRPPKILIVGHREALARQTAQQTGLPSYKDDDLDTGDSLVVCLNSIGMVGPRMGEQVPQFDLIILDEITQLHEHLGGSTFTSTEALHAYDLLKTLVKHATFTLGLDAGLNNHACQWARELFEEVQVIRNDYRQARGEFTLYQKAELVWTRIHQFAQEGKRIVVPTTYQESRRLATSLDEQDIPYLLVNRDTSLDDDVQAQLATINAHPPQVLIYTASLGSGIDLTYPVDAVLGIMKGQALHAPDIIQMVGRARHAAEHHLHIMPVANGSRETDPDRLLQTYITAAKRTAFEVGYNDYGICEATPRQKSLARLITGYEAERNASLNNLLAHTVALLADMGFTLVLNDHRNLAALHHQQKVAEREHNATRDAITNADPISDFEFDCLQHSGDLTEEVRYGHERWKIEQAIGQPLDDLLYEAWHKPADQLKLATIADLFLSEAVLKMLDLHEADRKGRNGHLLHLRKHHLLHARLTLDLVKRLFCTTRLEHLMGRIVDGLEIQNAVEAWREAHYDAIHALQPQWLTMKPTRLLYRIFKRLGLGLNRGKRVNILGTLSYQYHMDDALLYKMITAIEARLQARYQTYLESLTRLDPTYSQIPNPVYRYIPTLAMGIFEEDVGAGGA